MQNSASNIYEHTNSVRAMGLISKAVLYINVDKFLLTVLVV